MTHPRRLARVTVAAAFGALVAACAGSAADSAVIAEPEVVSTQPDPTATEAPAPTPQPTPVPTATPQPTPTPEPQFTLDLDLLARLPEGWDPFVDAGDVDAPTAAVPPGGTLPDPGTQANRWKYTGVLGELKPNERVVPAVADPPPAVDGAAALTGLPGPNPDRPALVVKIDNVPRARPQIGLNEADIVFEELVEAGVTRFAAVFHSNAPATIGPVRSGRSTDIGIIDSFNRPIFAFSGANSIYEKLIDKQPIENRGAEVFGGYWRSGSRPAPHNMYTSAKTMLDSVADGKAPTPHFAYRDPDEAPPDSASPAESIRLTYLAGLSTSIDFTWDGDLGGWRRRQAGSAHVDANGVPYAPTNVVIQFVNYIDTGMTDKWGEDLYEGVSVGSGAALIFTDGRVQEAIWTRSTLRSVTTYTDADGAHVELVPGTTFVALISPGGAAWS